MYRSKTAAIAIFWLLMCLGLTASADSPVTSTDFHTAYADIPIVAYAARAKTIDDKIAAALLSPKTGVDIKAAIVNALSWDINGKRNAAALIAYLNNKYKSKTLDENKLSADELMVLGYLTVMDNYFKPDSGLPYLRLARQKTPHSYTIAMVYVIVSAQRDMDQSFCMVWEATALVRDNETLNQDMRPEAVAIIMDYLALYRDDCKRQH